MKGEIWLIRVLAILLLLASIALSLKTNTSIQSLWMTIFGIANAITLWVVSNKIRSDGETEEVPMKIEIAEPPYHSVDFASLLIDISQFYGRSLTYKQVCYLQLFCQAKCLFTNGHRLVKDDFWLSDGIVTTRGVETSFRRYKQEITTKMSLLHFPNQLLRETAFIVGEFNPRTLEGFEEDPAVKRLWKQANDNGGLVTDEMIIAFWKELIGFNGEEMQTSV